MYVPRGEPPRLFWLFVAGAVLMAAGLAAAVAVGLSQGLWSGDPPIRGAAGEWCLAQNHVREARERDAKDRMTREQARRKVLDDALDSPDPAVLPLARLASDSERRVLDDLDRELRMVNIDPMSRELGGFALVMLLTILVAFGAARGAALHGRSALGEWPAGPDGSRWWRPFACTVAIVWVPNLFCELYTSVWSVEKVWFGWSSFCVSHEVWAIFLVVVALGEAMVIAYPAALLWELGAARRRPTDVDPANKDGRWGVGKYVLFLQTWAYLPLFCVVLPITVWLRTMRGVPGFSTPHLFPPLIVLAFTGVASGRMVRDAIAIRRLYREKLEGLGGTWQEIGVRNSPPDPTIPLLGEHWWSLPAVILGGGGTLWLVVERLGVADLFLGLLKMK